MRLRLSPAMFFRSLLQRLPQQPRDHLLNHVPLQAEPAGNFRPAASFAQERQDRLLVGGQPRHQLVEPFLKTVRRLAVEFGVSPRTILRDARYAAAVDAVVANCGDDVRELALSWGAPLRRADIFKLAQLDADEQRQALDLVRQHGRSALAADSEPGQQTITVPLEREGMARKLLDALGLDGLTAAIEVMQRVVREYQT
jgi:hypothetical protein